MKKTNFTFQEYFQRKDICGKIVGFLNYIYSDNFKTSTLMALIYTRIYQFLKYAPPTWI